MRILIGATEDGDRLKEMMEMKIPTLGPRTGSSSLCRLLLPSSFPTPSSHVLAHRDRGWGLVTGTLSCTLSVSSTVCKGP